MQGKNGRDPGEAKATFTIEGQGEELIGKKNVLSWLGSRVDLEMYHMLQGSGRSWTTNSKGMLGKDLLQEYLTRCGQGKGNQ